MNKLKIENLSKHYGKKAALNNVSITFTDGIYGLLGPNGAGKSTLMNIVTQNISADNGGDIFWNDEKTSVLGVKFRSLIGFMPQQQELYPTFTAERFVGYLAALKGIVPKEIKGEVARVLALVELSDCANKKIGGFSGGMKQRVLIAQALLGDPKLIILDEPTAGLDPKGRDEILDQIAKIHNERHITVILVSHSMEDVAKYVGRIIVMDHGMAVYDGAPKEVFSHYKELEKIGLAAPQVTYAMHALRERGIPVTTEATTVMEAGAAILEVWKGIK